MKRTATVRLTATAKLTRTVVGIVTALCLLTPLSALAGGGQHYPLGIADFISGALPPQGLYLINNLVYGEKDRIVDNSGNTVPVDFHARLKLLTTRLVYVTPYSLFGGQFAMHGIVPLYDIEVERGPMTFDDTGVGDVLISPFNLGWHFGPKLHLLASIDVMTPLGDYDKRNPATTLLSKNHWTISPGLAMTLKEDKYDITIRGVYDFHTKNDEYFNPASGMDSELDPGEEFHIDYALGFVPAPGWRLGVVGYNCWQTTDDVIDGVKVADKRTRIASIGPAISYSPKRGLTFTVKHYQEFASRNTAEGYKTYLKMIYKF